MDEPFEIEARGAEQGINPMFGDWRQRFDIEPVSYANPGPARNAFKRAVRQNLRNKFIFVGLVSVTITLYLDARKVLETPAYGDLDNFAKQFLDTFKGRGGLLIDDCQVQRLGISWVDIPFGARFDVEFNSGPDDFMLEPLKLFGMPDGLFYPLSETVWSKEGPVTVPTASVLTVARQIASMTAKKRSMRHQLRQGGCPPFRAFQLGRSVSPVIMGFHRSRVVDSGYELLEWGSWATE